MQEMETNSEDNNIKYKLKEYSIVIKIKKKIDHKESEKTPSKE